MTARAKQFAHAAAGLTAILVLHAGEIQSLLPAKLVGVFAVVVVILKALATEPGK